MTEAEFHDSVVAFMARIDATLTNLPCRGKDGCSVSGKTDLKKWVALGVGIGAGSTGLGGGAVAISKLLGIG